MNDWYMAEQGISQFKNKHVEEDSGSTGHFVNFLPGITFVSSGIDCYADRKYPQGAWAFFEKKGGANYFREPYPGSETEIQPDFKDSIENVQFNPDDFITFYIPTQITQSPQAQMAEKTYDQ